MYGGYSYASTEYGGLQIFDDGIAHSIGSFIVYAVYGMALSLSLSLRQFTIYGITRDQTINGNLKPFVVYAKGRSNEVSTK